MADKRVTISDIARESGASPTTVSLVLRDKGGIGQETRERVLAAAQALGYERKSIRRPGQDGVTTVALLFRAHSPYPEGGANGVNPFYSWVLTGMEAAARARRMNLLYGTIIVDHTNVILDIPRHLLDQDIAGAIVVGAFSDEDIASMQFPLSCPIVVVDGPGPSTHHDVVASDNVEGARMAVSHLIAAGHTRIALVSRPPAHNVNFRERERGYRQIMQEHGLQPIVGAIHQRGVDRALDTIFSQAPETTAIFCANDQFALEIFDALDRRGLYVPNDISLVGFDDIDHARNMRPSLTTLHVDKVSMGRFAISLLDHRLHWPDTATTTITLAPSLIQRGSVAKLTANV